MKFKVGDLVRVRPDLTYNPDSKHGVADSMKQYAGDIFKVISLMHDGYKLGPKEGDRDNGWSWDDTMLIPVNDTWDKILG